MCHAARRHGAGKGSLAVKPRNLTTFLWDPELKEVVRKWDKDIKGPFGFDLRSFEQDYRSTPDDLRLQARFDFTVLKEPKSKHHDGHGSYRLCQVHLEPNGHYRMIMLRSDELDAIRYIWAFKKTRWEEKRQIDHAIQRASRIWRILWRE